MLLHLYFLNSNNFSQSLVHVNIRVFYDMQRVLSTFFQTILLMNNYILVNPHTNLFTQFIVILPSVRAPGNILGVLPTVVCNVIVLAAYLTVEAELAWFLCTMLLPHRNFDTGLPPLSLLGASRLVGSRPGWTVPEEVVSIPCCLNLLKAHIAHWLFLKRELELPSLARPPIWHDVGNRQDWDP